MSEKAQRLRIRFARGPEAATIGHLDLARTWERAFLEAFLLYTSEGVCQWLRKARRIVPRRCMLDDGEAATGP